MPPHTQNNLYRQLIQFTLGTIILLFLKTLTRSYRCHNIYIVNQYIPTKIDINKQYLTKKCLRGIILILMENSA